MDLLRTAFRSRGGAMLPTDDVPAPHAPNPPAIQGEAPGMPNGDDLQICPKPTDLHLFKSKEKGAPLAASDPCDRMALSRTEVKLHPSWRETALGPSMDADGHLDVDRVSADQLLGLSSSQRKTLMALLSRTTVQSAKIRPDGSEVSAVALRAMRLGRPVKLNAASALLLKTLLTGDREAALKLLAATPPEAVGIARHQPIMKDLVSGDGLRKLLREMRQAAFAVEPSHLPEDQRRSLETVEPSELNTLGTVVHFALSRGAKDQELDLDALAKMGASIRDAVGEDSVDDVGIMMGVLVAGLAKLHQEQSGMERLIKTGTQGAGNQLWAWSFLAGSAAGVVGVLAVTSYQLLSGVEFGSMNYQDVANRLRNEVEVHWMQNHPENWSTTDVHHAVLWVRKVLDANSVTLNSH